MEQPSAPQEGMTGNITEDGCNLDLFHQPFPLLAICSRLFCGSVQLIDSQYNVTLLSTSVFQKLRDITISQRREEVDRTILVCICLYLVQQQCQKILPKYSPQFSKMWKETNDNVKELIIMYSNMCVIE